MFASKVVVVSKKGTHMNPSFVIIDSSVSTRRQEAIYISGSVRVSQTQFLIKTGMLRIPRWQLHHIPFGEPPFYMKKSDSAFRSNNQEILKKG